MAALSPRAYRYGTVEAGAGQGTTLEHAGWAAWFRPILRLAGTRRWVLSEAREQGNAAGAGPGRADLITVRGLSLLRQAEVVIYDRLIAPELLDEVSPQATLLFVGKKPGHHAVQQTAINRLLVEHVQMGKQVVRLKGGDPFVFGAPEKQGEMLSSIESALCCRGTNLPSPRSS